jgi:hypothetical protein
MSSSTVLRILCNIPVPGFGNAAVLGSYAKNCARAFHPKLVTPWVFPGVVGLYWFIWPAVDDEFKIRIGLMKDPTPVEEPPPVKLDAKALAAIAKAPMGHVEHGPSEDDVKAEILKSVGGDQVELKKEWDSFYAKSTKPGEDDDDDEGRFDYFHIHFLKRSVSCQPPCLNSLGINTFSATMKRRGRGGGRRGRKRGGRRGGGRKRGGRKRGGRKRGGRKRG